MEAFAPRSWETLPPELLEIIFSKIDNRQHLGLLRLVSSSWWSVINHSLKSLRLKRKDCVGDFESLGRTFPSLQRLEISSRDEDILHKLSSVKSLTDIGLYWVLRDRSWGSNGVEFLTNLSRLQIFAPTGNVEPKFMEMVCTLSNLTSLSLGSRSIDGRSIVQLSAMTHLTRLSLYDLFLTDLEILSGLTNFEVLKLANTRWWGFNSDVSPLSSLVNLTTLHFWNWEKIGRSRFENCLAKLKNLTWLDMRKCGVNDGDLAKLTGLSKLTHLDLRQNRVADKGVRLLTGLVSLKRLFLVKIRAKNAIQMLAPLTGLEVLYLDRTPTQGTDLVGLSNLVGLKEVSVRHCKIEKGDLERVSAALPHIKFSA